MRSRQNILMSIIRAQGATLSEIEKEIAAEEDAMKQKCRDGYVNLILIGSFFSRLRLAVQKCRGAVKVFADEFSHASRARGGCARTRR